MEREQVSILIIRGMMDSKRRIKVTMDTNMQIISEKSDTRRTNIARPLAMKMNMISIQALDMKKDTSGPMGGTLAVNRTMDMSMTNGK